MTWMRLVSKARVAVMRDFVTDVSYRVTFIIELADAVLMLLSYVFLSRVFGGARPDGYDPRAFVLIGIAVSGGLGMVAASFVVGRSRHRSCRRTIKTVMATPTSPATYLSISAIYPIARALSSTPC